MSTKFGIVGKKKNQFYVSIPVGIFGILLATARTYPMSLDLYVSLPGLTLMLIGSFCIINALNDSKKMNMAERILAIVWSIILLPLTLLFIVRMTGF